MSEHALKYEDNVIFNQNYTLNNLFTSKYHILAVLA